jgi:hypothetical protein
MPFDSWQDPLFTLATLAGAGLLAAAIIWLWWSG